MRAAVFKSVGTPLVLERVVDPIPQPKEMILRVQACGICGTDLHMTENQDSSGGWRLLEPGCVLGHEFSGDIVELGSMVKGDWSVGDRVTALPWIGCGDCEWCFCGRPYRCSSVINRASLGLPGAYSEFCRVGAAEAIRLPDDVNYDAGALVEPLAVGLNAVERAAIKGGEQVLIMGAGPVGLAVVMWCRFFGAKDIVVSDLRAERAQAALSLGATEAIDASRKDATEQILDQTGESPGIIFDCVGLQGSLQMAIDLASSGAAIIVVGLCMQMDSYFPAKALLKELDIRFAYVYSRKNFETVIGLIRENRIDPLCLVSSRIGLNDLPKTFETLRNPSSELKVLLKPV